MSDHDLIRILYRDGYHAAAKRMEQLLSIANDVPRHGRWEGYTHSRFFGTDESGEPTPASELRMYLEK